jgi:hypothetical protein
MAFAFYVQPNPPPIVANQFRTTPAWWLWPSHSALAGVVIGLTAAKNCRFRLSAIAQTVK